MTALPSLIRQIGDPVLHAAPGRADPGDAAGIEASATGLAEKEHRYGGVGIASNQCADIAVPLAIILVGSDDAATREAAQRRYPGETIPPATLMINPEIMRLDGERYFPPHGEGCLSVAGPIRGKVARYRSLRLRYQQADGIVCERDCSGFEAHIVQHECDHLRGVVFLQTIFEECDADQRASIAAALQAEARRRELAPAEAVPAPGDPVMVFDRAGDAVVFDVDSLAQALTRVPAATLAGMSASLSALPAQ